MIKKINIKKFGLYNDFVWDKNVIDNTYFQKENILYGRNYSGKTTLSRIIRALETGSISHEYNNYEFKVTLNDGTDIDQSNFKNRLNVKCYNIDFVKENIRFLIDERSDIEPFAILGNSNQETLDNIKKIQSELGSNTDGKKTLKYKELEDLESEIQTVNEDFTKKKTNKTPFYPFLIQNSRFDFIAEETDDILVKKASFFKTSDKGWKWCDK